MTRSGKAALMTIFVGTALLAGGCAATAEDEGATSTVDPNIATEALVSCLKDAGLPAKLDDVEGMAQMTWEEGHDILAVDPEGTIFYIEVSPLDDDAPDANADFERFMQDHSVDGGLSYGLEVDGRDYSDVYEQCAKSSGYEEPVPEADQGTELAAKSALAQITNDWVACARENGYPTWADVEPGEADDWMTSPTAYIPLSMSTDALEALLIACPSFDLETAERIESEDFDATGEFAAQPSVQIESPQAPLSDSDTAPDSAAQPEADHYADLWEVLGRAEAEFYAARASQAGEES